MRRCYLVRHGQTDWNLEDRIQGHSDIPLNALGRDQARRAGLALAHRPLRGLYTSHLLRTRQTGAAILSANGHAHVTSAIEPGVAEIHLGAWEGLTPAEIDVRYPGAYAEWRVRPSVVTIPEAESVSRFRSRVLRAFEKLLDDFREGEYVVVTHGGVIAALLADLLGSDFDSLLRRLRLDNAGITALDLDARPAHVLWINSILHLEPEAGLSIAGDERVLPTSQTVG